MANPNTNEERLKKVKEFMDKGMGGSYLVDTIVSECGVSARTAARDIERVKNPGIKYTSNGKKKVVSKPTSTTEVEAKPTKIEVKPTPKPKKVKVGTGIVPKKEITDGIDYAIATREPTIFHGNAGNGKSFMIDYYHTQIGRPLAKYNMSVPLSKLIQGRDIVVENGASKTTYTDGYFLKFMKDNPSTGTFCFDELNQTDPSKNQTVNRAMDSPQSNPSLITQNGEIKLPEGYAVLGCMNIGSRYGKHKLPWEQVDRCTWIHVPDFTMKEMETILKPHSPSSMLSNLVGLIKKTREWAKQNGQEECPMTTRTAIQLAKQLSFGWTWKRATQNAFTKFHKDGHLLESLLQIANVMQPSKKV